jgi:hypothetical protein
VEVDDGRRGRRRLPQDLVHNGAGDPECLTLESLPNAVFARARILPVLADGISWRLIATRDTADYYTDES